MVVQSKLTLRTTPSVLAANGLSRRFVGVLETAAQLLSLTTLPLWVVKWIFSRKRQPLKIYLIAHIYRTTRFLAPYLLTREDNTTWRTQAGKSNTLIPTSQEDWDIVSLTTITASAASAAQYTAGVPIPQGVEGPVDCPGFILSPKSARGAGDAPAENGEKIIIYYHGGAYVVGHPLWTPFAVKIARDSETRVYAAQYRKTVDTGASWPTPLLDALVAWNYVVNELHFSPANVALMGDSAGGNLAVAVSTYLGSAGFDVPGGLALASPWVDMTMSSPTWRTKPDDYLSERWIRFAISSNTRYLTKDSIASALISPALAPVGSFAALQKAGTEVFVSVGTDETLEGEIRAFVRNLRGDGVVVDVWDDEGGLHDGPVFTGIFAEPKSYQGFAAGVVRLINRMGKKD